MCKHCGFVHYDERRQRFGIDWRETLSIAVGELLLQEMLLARPFIRGRLLDVGCGVRPYALINESLVEASVGQRNFRELLERTCGLDWMDMRMVFVPDEVYFFRKHGFMRNLTPLLLVARKALRALSSDLYTRLLTDHCIVLVRSY